MTCTAWGAPLGVGIPAPPPLLGAETTAMGALVSGLLVGLLILVTLVILLAGRGSAR